jgi:hypothetical protein
MQQIDYYLESKRQKALGNKNKLFSTYMQSFSKEHKYDLLLSCTGWEKPQSDSAVFSSNALIRLLDTSRSPQQQGGYFLRCNGIGICINPGRHFFDHFCAQGFHLWEIDYCIVTKEGSEASQDLELIHTLNRELNATLLSYEQEPHLIRYLLHTSCFGTYASRMRPLFREEKESVLCIEPFDEEEKLALSDEVSLVYRKRETDGSLMIRFELPQSSIGYSSDISPEESTFFSICDTLITKALPQTDLCPKLKLLLLGEFSHAEGDIRIELAKKVKRDFPYLSVLPLDAGLEINLERSTIKLMNPDVIACQEATVVRMQDFGPLMYLSSDQVL